MTSYIKEQRLIELLRELKSVAIAFTGGVDSTYLASIAKQTLGAGAIAITVNTGLIPEKELKSAREIAEKLGIKHQIIDLQVLSNPLISENSEERCYYCKMEIMKTLRLRAEKDGINILLDGTNYDDLSEYRPGIKALKLLEIRSPLSEIGFTKEEIRERLYEYGLAEWCKPASSCLATRIAYHQSLNAESLRQIEQAEAFLYVLGIASCRVRLEDNQVRIEVPLDNFPLIFNYREQIVSYFMELGFEQIALDLQGLRSGSFDQNRRND